MNSGWEAILNELAADACLRELRTLRPVSPGWLEDNGQLCMNCSGNDYLGLAENPDLLRHFQTTTPPGLWRMSASASRLLTGTHPAHELLENELAAAYPGKFGLVFNSGYHANVGLFQALLDDGDAVFADRLNHASLWDGLRLSKAAWFRYRHRDMNHLEDLLTKHRGRFKRALLVSESVFSMDGTLAPGSDLVALKKRHDLHLMLDEAHSVGVLGPGGRGLAAAENNLSEIDILLGTFGKAYASVGAFVVSSSLIKKILINKARSFIFSTALPPFNLAWTALVIKRAAAMDAERERLHDLHTYFRRRLTEAGWQTRGTSQIVPLILGSNEKALALAAHLQKAGILALAVRPPSVPPQESRIRFSLHAKLTIADIDRIMAALPSAVACAERTAKVCSHPG
jgi:8-amino-7-oxononanoate synthase